MKDNIIQLVEQQVIEAWNTQNAEKVVAAYTEDLIYRDPNVEKEIRGRRDMYHYMTDLYAMWDLHLTLKSAYPLKDIKGATVLWHGTFKRAGKVGQIDGMEIVIFEGDLVKHNEVMFDRLMLAGLLS